MTAISNLKSQMRGSRRRWLAASALGVLMVTVALAAPGGGSGPEIDWHTIDGGGDISTFISISASTEIELLGSIGQPESIRMTYDNPPGGVIEIEILGGFAAATTSSQLNWTGGPGGSSSGQLTNEMLWDEGGVPGGNDTLVFDFATPLLAVQIPVTQDLGRIVVVDSLVRLDFSSTDLNLLENSSASPSLVIGRDTDPTFPAELRVRASGSGAHGLHAKSVSIGDAAGAPGKLVISPESLSSASSVFTNVGVLWIGRRGNGELRVESASPGGAQATSTGGISIGVAAGVTGRAVVSGANSLWTTAGMPGGGHAMLIGEHGTGRLEISNGAKVVSGGFEGGITLGKQPNSMGIVSVTGAGSRWEINHPLINSGDGIGQILLSSGGEITYNTSAPQPIRPTIALGPTGTLSGAGTVNGDVQSFGDVRPGDVSEVDSPMLGPVATGRLEINGEYRQADEGIGNNPTETGSLHLRIGGTTPQAQYDQLQVNGLTTLGGGLFISLVNNYQPAPGTAPFDLLIAQQGTSERFDVAYMPAISSDANGARFLQVAYDGPLAGGGGTVSLNVVPLNLNLGFGDPVGQDIAGAPQAAVLGDFDADGHLDIAVAVDGANPDSDPGTLLILRNNINNICPGAGPFCPPQPAPQPLGVRPRGLAVGNFDDVGGDDIAIANEGSSILNDSVQIFINNNTGGSAFTQSQLIDDANLVNRPRGIVAGSNTEDFDPTEPGVEIAWTNATAAGFVTLMRPFLPVPFGTAHPAGHTPSSVDPADVDNDKDVDFVMCNSGGTVGTVSLIVQDGDHSGDFSTPVAPIDVGLGPVVVVAVDLNLDGVGFADIVTANLGDGTISVLLNTTTGTTPTFAPAVNIDIGDNPRSIAAANLEIGAQGVDADVDLAVVVDGEEGPVVRVLRNDVQAPGGQLTFAPAEDLSTGGQVRFVLAGEVDGEVGDDLIAVDASSGGNLAGGGEQVHGALPGRVHILGNTAVNPCPADIGGSAGVVNIDDLLAVINGWGICPQPCPPTCPADVNNTCVVNIDDLLAVINSWGACGN
jgi:T5SS/PEP-CTERM-associated repeat protein